jgi:hypothetical protein
MPTPGEERSGMVSGRRSRSPTLSLSTKLVFPAFKSPESMFTILEVVGFGREHAVAARRVVDNKARYGLGEYGNVLISVKKIP